ncbi:hypothetical protein IQ06DRAFT_288920 [Phaeosphaeriaceae sp. SRC1lsM3a]|nr:hypothetical protein IQ06DRAFT_288920 [Stagonospora sp. SRC1lsM3a]
MAPAADLTAQSPPARIPKLKYRNPLPADVQLPSLEARRNQERLLRDNEDPPATPSSTTTPSEYRPSFDTASLTSSSLASTASSQAASDDSKGSTKKKKKGSVFGFLTLKEPSQAAFEQYAEAQRKQAATKETSLPASRPPSNYAAKKLPEDLPKVNSKWDGVPESLKNRHSKTATSAKSSDSARKRLSTASQESKSSRAASIKPSPAPKSSKSSKSVMTDGTHNPPDSVASPVLSVSMLDIQDRDRSPPPSSTLPEMSYYFPEPLDGGDAQVPSIEPSIQTSIEPKAYQPTVAGMPSPPPGMTFDYRSLLDDDADSRSESPALSTDSGDTIVRDTADVIFQKLNERPQESLWGDAPAVQPPSGSSKTAVPESHDFLFEDLTPIEPSNHASVVTIPSVPHYAPTRPVQNFSRPISSPPTSPARSTRSASYRKTPISSALPTLYEASLASTNSDSDSDSDHTVQDYDDSDARSIAPSTIAPSVLSAHWHDSPRERLGLGGRLRMDANTPWESQGDAPAVRHYSHMSTRNTAGIAT